VIASFAVKAGRLRRIHIADKAAGAYDQVAKNVASPLTANSVRAR
jgi:hypothetical protein